MPQHRVEPFGVVDFLGQSMATSSSPFRALTHYRLLPQIIGWPALIVGFLARTPFAMIPLGVMTAFTAATGNVAIGGLATGITSMSTAVGAPLLGRVAEKAGQRRLLLTVVPINALGLLSLFLLSLQDSVSPLLWAVCMVTGFTSIPVGSYTRSRWVQKTTTPYQLAAAFSYESMADELVFVLGPALVGIAASAAVPSAPLGLAFVLMVVAGLAFAFTAPGVDEVPTAQSSDGQTNDSPPILRVIWSVSMPVVALIAIGAYFGSSQAGITQRAEMLGVPGQAGLVYAVMGIGSAIAAIMVVMIPERVPFWVRLVISGVGMSAGMGLIGWASGLPLTAVLMAITGFFVGPSLVTAFSIAERLAPPEGITVAMTALSSSVTIGVALGSSLGGALAASLGADAAFWLASAAAALMAAFAVTARRVG